MIGNLMALKTAVNGGKSLAQKKTIQASLQRSPSRWPVGLAAPGEARRCSPPCPVHQQQTHEQGPGTYGREEEGQRSVGLQQKVARIGLPNHEDQHAYVHRQSPPAAARLTEMRAEAVSATPVVKTPAEVISERHIEEEHLWMTDSMLRLGCYDQYNLNLDLELPGWLPRHR